MIAGVILQTFTLSVLTARTNWNTEVTLLLHFHYFKLASTLALANDSVNSTEPIAFSLTHKLHMQKLLCLGVCMCSRLTMNSLTINPECSLNYTCYSLQILN